MADIEILHFETSPYGNMDAIVQQDGQSVYMYLIPREPHSNVPPKACWVRNLVQGPYVINQNDLIEGRPVLLPRNHTKSNQPGSLPDRDQLKIIWFEEGTGAALVETLVSPSGDSQQTLAIIPPWSGENGFHGYAADCAVESVIASPMPPNPKLQQGIDRAQQFWDSFSRLPDPFIECRDQWLNYLDQSVFGDSQPSSSIERQYFKIEKESFPPVGLVQYSSENQIMLSTAGMSLCPQPFVELSSPDPRQHRRIELMMILDPIPDPALLNRIRSQLARLAGYPWRNLRWLGAQHTCEFPDIFEGTDRALLIDTADRLKRVEPYPEWGPFYRSFRSFCESPESRSTPEWRGDPVNPLWLISG